MTGLLTRLHKLAWSQWEHRNKTLHDPNMKWQTDMKQALDDTITEEYSRGIADLPPCDRSHFALPLLPLLARSLDYKKAWLVNVTTARHRQARRRSEAADALADTRHRSDMWQFCKTGKLPGRAHRSDNPYRPSHTPTDLATTPAVTH